jgi:diguanylate cyclase (GGDEF)-like protein
VAREGQVEQSLGICTEADFEHSDAPGANGEAAPRHASGMSLQARDRIEMGRTTPRPETPEKTASGGNTKKNELGMRVNFNLSIGGGFLLLMALMLVLVVNAVYRLAAVNRDLERIADEHIAKIEVVTGMQLAVHERTDALYNMVLLDDTAGLEPWLGKFRDGGTSVEAKREALLSRGLSEQEFINLSVQRRLVERLEVLQEDIVGMIREGDFDRARAVFRDEVVPIQVEFNAILARLRELQSGYIGDAVEKARSTYQVTFLFSVYLGFLSLALGALVVAVVFRRASSQAQAIESYIEQLATSRDEQQRLATHDDLTGLPNRALFNDRLAQAIVRAARHHNRIAVAFFDLDHFKAVNDNFGHHVGDLVLQNVGMRLAESVRHSDTVARLSGDEFAAILEDIGGRAKGAELVRNLLRSISQPMLLEGGADLTISASAGLSFYPEDAGTASELLRLADGAMYLVKASGRGDLRVCEEE